MVVEVDPTCMEPSKAAEALAKEAWNRWIAEEGNVVDDITVLILHIKCSGKDADTGLRAENMLQVGSASLPKTSGGSNARGSSYLPGGSAGVPSSAPTTKSAGVPSSAPTTASDEKLPGEP